LAEKLLKQLTAVLLAAFLAAPPLSANPLLGVGTANRIATVSAAVPTVTPDQIAGLRAWWKADTGLTTTSNVAAQFTLANTEYLSVNDAAGFPFSGDWTFAVWVKADSFTAGTGNFIAGQWDGGVNQLSWAVLYNDFTFNSNPKRFSFWTSVDGINGAVFNSSSAGQPAVGTWYFVVVKHVASSRTKKIKVNDGTEDSTTYASGTLWNSTARFCIGTQLSSNVPAQTWSGQMRLAGWWSRLTTNTEDTWLYNAGAGEPYSAIGTGNGSALGTNLVAYWNLGENNGTRVDSSTNTYNLTDNNTVTMSTGPVGGVNNSTNTYISAWADQSGNGYNLAATADKYALYVPNALNSLAGVQFDGVTAQLRVASMLGLTAGQGRTVGIVYKVPSASNASTVFIQGQSGSTSNPWSLDANTQGTAGTKFGIRSNNTFDATTSTCDTSYHVHYVAFSTMTPLASVTANTSYRIDLTTQTLSVANGFNEFGTMTSANFTGLGFFPAATDTQRASTVEEVAVFDHSLSATDRDSFENYLKTKFGL
jgi:hypothetical protein